MQPYITSLAWYIFRIEAFRQIIEKRRYSMTISRYAMRWPVNSWRLVVVGKGWEQKSSRGGVFSLGRHGGVGEAA